MAGRWSDHAAARNAAGHRSRYSDGPPAAADDRLARTPGGSAGEPIHDLDFDANGATIRQLLGQRSGIPDYYPALVDSLSTDRLHVWTPAEMLELVTADRAPAGEAFDYTDTNYLLLGLVIEQVRGQPVADVLRDGVLSG